MKTQHWGWLLTSCLWLAIAPGAVAQSPSPTATTPTTTSPTTTSPMPSPISPQDELEQLREEKRMEALLEEELKNNAGVRDMVQDEVDRAYSANTILLNILLTVLTLTPIVIAIASFWLRQGIVQEAVAETRKVLREEVEKQLSEEAHNSVVEQIVSETIKRLQQEEQQARQAVEEVKQQLNELQVEFSKQLSILQLQTAEALNAQPLKAQLLQEIDELTPSPAHVDSVPTDIQQRIQELTEELVKLQSTTPKLLLTASDYVKQGEAFYFEGRYQDALESYREAIRLKSDDPEIWINQAISLRRLGQYEQAIASHDKAIELRPDYRRAWYTKGYTLRVYGRYEDAIACFDRAIELDPQAYRSWDNRGSILKELGRYEEAIASYDKAIEIQPDYAKAWNHKARCYAQWGKIDLALESLSKSIDLNPEYRQLALTEADFNSIRQHPQFEALIHPSAVEV
ncbi:tetratricopeptide repeat protein [Oscillatoria sp. FACHB-1407]|uniref:tetratricopeptide repeat protein n=1 Tax=Oscillatoria sp. FACHB-1407 TaxID=2692847 RepID=UPI001686CAC7|nr:tetratricopeptide repeat protein [Oscillatoria sp. FACHB-1407]MBD2462581.1 tetratricopeptide repeat protein [Oscillatoria sp. FACHB-1407]